MSGCFAYYLLDLLVLSPNLPFFSFVYLNLKARVHLTSRLFNVSQNSGRLYVSHIKQPGSNPVILKTTKKDGRGFQRGTNYHK